jgi:VanZ family protein
MSERSTALIAFKYWIPAILVAILISIFSTRYFTDKQTGRIILPVLHWLFPSATGRMLYLMHVAIRKLAHVAEFGIFSAAVFRGVRAGRTGWRWSWALATLVIAVAYAGLDEWHQSFVPLRQATPRDAAIDVFGALLAQCVVWGYATRRWPFTALFRRHAGSAKNQEETS